MKAFKPLLSDAQLTLGGIEAPQPADRLFFAVFPDAYAAVDITHLAQTLRHQHKLHGNPVRKERLHVTLHFLGDYAGLPQALVNDAKQAAERVEAPVFDVMFNSVASFAGRSRKHPLVLRGSTGLQSLQVFQRQIGERLAAVGLGQFLERRFIPHVTLLYDDKVLKSQPTEPIRWMVREFSLVHSLLGRTEHRILGRWPLRTTS